MKRPSNYERTLVLIKPDGVHRGLMGEIITRFERKGLKITAMKMVWPSKEQAMQHYDWSEEEKIKSGNRSIEVYKTKGIEVTRTPIEIAEDIQARLMRYLTAGPVLAMVIESAHAVQHVRQITGHGSPLQADVGTIRSDFTIDSYIMADEADRAARNLIHASGSTDEAERELKVWFTEAEISDYETAIEKVLYSLEWEETKE